MFCLQRKLPNTYILWSVVILCLPLIGFCVYLVFGQGCRLRSYRKGRNKAKEDKTYIDFYNQGNSFYTNYKLPANASCLVKYNYNNGIAPYTTKNKLETYANNDQFFSKFLTDIELAEDNIRLEVYSFKNDEFGNQLRDLLISKAKSGVEVSILYDSLGSRRSSRLFFNALTLAGATIRRFNRRHFRYLCYSNAYRNMRNMFLIDGKICYIGSAQLSTNSRRLNNKISDWHDGMIRLEGEAVNYCTTRFYQDFNFASGKYHKLHLQTFDEEIKGKNPVQVVFDGPDIENYSIFNAIIQAISNAKNSIYIATQNYMPNKALHNALRCALLSGINVNIVIGSVSSCKWKHNVSMINLYSLEKLGAKVYVHDGVVNDKVVIVDSAVSVVGNVDIDINANVNNYNIASFVYDSTFNIKLIHNIDDLISNSETMGGCILYKTNAWNRFWMRFIKWLNPIV